MASIWQVISGFGKRSKALGRESSSPKRPRRSPDPYLAALGFLLSRTPLYAEAETVVPSLHVERAFAALSDLDWTEPELVEIQTLFLRAGRIVDNPNADVPKPLREKIASKPGKSGVTPLTLKSLRTFVPLALLDRSILFGESLPPRSGHHRRMTPLNNQNRETASRRDWPRASASAAARGSARVCSKPPRLAASLAENLPIGSTG